MSLADRRRHPRLEGEFPVDLLNMGDDPAISAFEAIVEGRALDVSRQGLRLKVPYNVAMGSVMSVILYYRGRESVCLCKVMWKREILGDYLYGLYIEEWSKLDSFLEQKLASMEKEESAVNTPSSPATSFATAV